MPKEKRHDALFEGDLFGQIFIFSRYYLMLWLRQRKEVSRYFRIFYLFI